MKFEHVSVLLTEAVDALNIKPNGVYLDATAGGGGHSYQIAERLNGQGRLICLDQDADAIAACKQRLKKFSNVTFVQENFKNASKVLNDLGIDKVDGILADLGVSSHQIDTPERGFSFLHDGKLDMRMNKDNPLSAYEVVNTYPQEKLKKILFEYGEESFAPKIAQAIVENRKQKPIETTLELKAIVESVFPKKLIFGKGGVTKKSFQALRIEVNGELEILTNAVEDFISLLAPKGRVAVITFHSLEDRLVKNVFKDAVTGCICPPKTPICICGHKAKGVLVSRKPILPTQDEIARNPRSRSAKLRIFEKN